MNTFSPLSPRLNLSTQSNFLLPGIDCKRSFTPNNVINTPKTPNLSPIVKPPPPSDSGSSFLKKRSPRAIVKRIQNKHRLKNTLYPHSPNLCEPVQNSFLDQTISVESTLKALKLMHLAEIFEKEEINTMPIFFTLKADDLKMIGIHDENDCKKILDFVGSFKTPAKPKPYRC